MLEDSDVDAGMFASRCLTSSSLDALFDIVIANAELRAGRTVVRDVLVALATAGTGQSIETLVGDDPDRAISVAHVLSVLCNHIHRIQNRYHLTPALRSAVERRYPLGGEAPRPATTAIDGIRERAALLTHRHWRETA
jgi:hypothetical protein